eukprot:SAG31_NODE_40418_length_281_cov_0.571429_1_plen_21_part_01
MVFVFTRIIYEGEPMSLLRRI